MDFKLLCEALYKGIHKLDDFKELILKLTYSMNDYRLSTNKSKDKSILTEKELNLIKEKDSVIEYLEDGRVKNLITNEIDIKVSNSIYIINKLGTISEEIRVKTLKEAADIIGINNYILSNKLKFNDKIDINGFKITRVGVFMQKKV